MKKYFLLVTSIFCLLSVCISNKLPINFTLMREMNPYYTFNMYLSKISVLQNNWLLFVQPLVTNKNIGKQILGTNFTRNGLNGRFTHSYIQYNNNKNISLFLGRKPVEWGQSKTYSIIQSGSLVTYDHIALTLKMENLTGEILTGQLGSEKIEEGKITRRIGGHKLTGQFLKNKFELQIGEQIIYTGVNRNVELFYLNPAVPFVFAAYDGDDLNTERHNNDNGMIFINGRYRFDLPVSAYFEFILDDYQIHDNSVQNMLGYKLGFQGKSMVSNFDINWETEFTHINSWTYIHHGQFTNWQNRGHALGYPYGTDLSSFYVQSDSWLKTETLKINFEYTWLEKGANNINTFWGNEDTLGDSFPTDPVKVYNLFEISILYKSKYILFETGYTNKPFPYEIANGLINDLKGGLFLSAGLYYHMDI